MRAEHFAGGLQVVRKPPPSCFAATGFSEAVSSKPRAVHQSLGRLPSHQRLPRMLNMQLSEPKSPLLWRLFPFCFIVFTTAAAAGDLRPCVESVEIFHDLGATKVTNQEFIGNKWYRFYDPTARKYLQMSDRVPAENSGCTGWINGDGARPGIKDGIIERNVCVKENSTDCNRQFTVRIRNCAGFYIYNVSSSNETAGFSYCFDTATETGYVPSIALMSKTNSALSNHVFHVETEISDSSKCFLMCSLTEQCQSYNYSNKENMCELNSSTRRKHPDDFVPRDGYNYYMKGKGLLSRKLGDL